jgi:hypothetical protein
MRPVKYILALLVMVSVLEACGQARGFSSHWLVYTSALLVAAGAVAIYLLLLRRRVEPIPHVSPVMVIDSRIRLEFLTGDGSRARYLKQQVCRANMDDIVSYVETGLFADGSIGSITTDDGTEIGTRVFEEDDGVRGLPQRPGRALEIRYKVPHKAGDIFTSLLSFEYLNSFKANREYFTASIGHTCLHFLISIHAHPDRPFKRIWLEYQYQGSRVVKDGEGVLRRILDSRGMVTEFAFQEKRPLVGSKYTFWWEW